MSRILALAMLWALAACGGSSATTSSEPSGDTLFTSAGSDNGREDDDAVPEPISTGPAPIALPTPPVPRGAMSVEVQSIWTRGEEILADPPPAAPPNDSEAVSEWAATELADFVRRRMTALSELTDRAVALEHAPLYERAVAAAIVGYAVEDMVADVRGAPVPATITSDPELLTVYREALDAQLRPLAERSAAAYQACAVSLDNQADPSWGEWRAFCFERAEELEEIYGEAGADSDGGDD